MFFQFRDHDSGVDGFDAFDKKLGVQYFGQFIIGFEGGEFADGGDGGLLSGIAVGFFAVDEDGF